MGLSKLDTQGRNVSQQPSILIIDLPSQAASFVQALAKVGRNARALTLSQLDEALLAETPLALIAPFEIQAELINQLRAHDAQALPVFVLEKNASGSLRPLMPDVTARLAHDVDPGILAMRMQIALQTASRVGSRSATVVGLPEPGSAPAATSPRIAPAAPPPLVSEPPKDRNTEPGPAAPPQSTNVVPSPVTSSSSDDSVAAGTAPMPYATTLGPPPGPPGFPPSGPASAPTPAPPVASPPASSTLPLGSPGTPAETLPQGTRLPQETSDTDKARCPEAPPPPAAEQPFTGPASFSAPSLPSQGESDPAGLMGAVPARGRKLGTIAAAAALLVVALLGVFILTGGDDEQTVSGEPIAASNTKAASDDQAALEKKQAAEAKKNAEREAAKKAEAEKLAAAEAAAEAKKNAEAAATSDEGMFRVTNAPEAETCEKTVGHPAQYYAKTAKWRAGHAWKLARKNLMAGQGAAALEQMCRSAFIDSKGPGTSGLVKYYLGRRELNQALAWAEVGVSEKTTGASGRASAQLLGDVLNQLGRVDEAKKVWLESFGLTEQDADRLDAVSRTFLRAALKARRGGDSALAEQLLRRAATFRPEDGEVAAELARTLLNNEQPQLAKRWAERALRLDDGSKVAQGVLASL